MDADGVPSIMTGATSSIDKFLGAVVPVFSIVAILAVMGSA